MISQNKAWQYLTEDEKLAVSLKYGHGKSTWEAGEIMDKSHYKFLEILARGKYLLKLYNDHLLLYEELVPDYIPLHASVKYYFEQALGQRLKPSHIAKQTNDTNITLKRTRDTLIIADLRRLKLSEDAVERNFAIFIFEFDRWNSFRILPEEIQEPSAYKRRQKKAALKKLDRLIKYNALAYEILFERFHYPYKYNKANIFYVPTLNTENGGILRVKENQDVFDYLSSLGLLIFKKKSVAQDFHELVIKYKTKDFRSPKDGMDFWESYRKLAKNAINYNNLEKAIPERKFLEYLDQYNLIPEKDIK